MIDPSAEIALQLVSGVCWTATYVFVMLRGARDQTLVMPFAALCANLAWEFHFTIIEPHHVPQVFVNAVWLVFDLGIVVQGLRYGDSVVPATVPVRWRVSAWIAALLLAYGLVVAISHEFSDTDGRYAAFGQNLMMSVLFVTVALRREGVAGLSFYVGVLKLLGTTAASLLFALLFPASLLLHVLYVGIFAFDIIYVALVVSRLRSAGLVPWRRV